MVGSRPARPVWLGGAIENTRSGRVKGVFPRQNHIESFLHRLLAGPGYGREAGVWRLRDQAVAPSFASFPGVGLQQDACLHQRPCGMFAGMDQAIQPLSLLRAELHDIFLYGDLFGGHESTPSLRYGGIDSQIILTVNDGGLTPFADPVATMEKYRCQTRHAVAGGEQSINARPPALPFTIRAEAYWELRDSAAY